MANRRPSLPHLWSFWARASKQSRPRRRIVGQLRFLGNIGARSEKPGIERTCSGLGTLSITFGKWVVIACFSVAGGSCWYGYKASPSMMRALAGADVPRIVVEEWVLERTKVSGTSRFFTFGDSARIPGLADRV